MSELNKTREGVNFLKTSWGNLPNTRKHIVALESESRFNQNQFLLVDKYVLIVKLSSGALPS